MIFIEKAVLGATGEVENSKVAGLVIGCSLTLMHLLCITSPLKP